MVRAPVRDPDRTPTGLVALVAELVKFNPVLKREGFRPEARQRGQGSRRTLHPREDSGSEGEGTLRRSTLRADLFPVEEDNGKSNNVGLFE